MHRREARKQRFACRLEVHLDLPAIGFARLALHEAERLAACDERDDAVMLRLQPLGEFADGRPFAVRIALDVQQQQLLQRRHAFALRGALGEAFETPHLVAEFGQLLEVAFGQRTSAIGHRRGGRSVSIARQYITT